MKKIPASKKNGKIETAATRAAFEKACARLKVTPDAMTQRLIAAFVETAQAQKGDRFAIPLKYPKVTAQRYVEREGKGNEPVSVYPEGKDLPWDPFTEEIWQMLERDIRRNPAHAWFYKGFAKSLEHVPYLAHLREHRAAMDACHLKLYGPAKEATA